MPIPRKAAAFVLTVLLAVIIEAANVSSPQLKQMANFAASAVWGS